MAPAPICSGDVDVGEHSWLLLFSAGDSDSDAARAPASGRARVQFAENANTTHEVPKVRPSFFFLRSNLRFKPSILTFIVVVVGAVDQNGDVHPRPPGAAPEGRGLGAGAC